jgi:SecD/SecF fusion protein
MVPNLGRKIAGLIFFSALALFAIFAYKLNLGLDLQGGARLVYAFDFEEAAKRGDINPAELANKPMLLQQMADVFSKRVDASGVADIPVVPQGDNQIVIEVPGKDQGRLDQIKSLMLNQGLLDFSIIASDTDDVSLTAERAKFEAWMDANPQGSALDFNRLAESEGGPRGEVRWIPLREEELPSALAYGATRNCVPLLVQDHLRPQQADSSDSWDFNGSELKYVGPTIDQAGLPAVAFEFQEDRKSAFSDFTDEYTNRPMAIVLNNELFTAPKINGRLPGGGIIMGGRGGFDPDERNELVTALRTGSLRVLPELQSEIVVGPSLGADSIKAGVRSSLIGAAIVIAFMMWYYRLNGVVAALSLAFNGFLLLGAMYFTKATLTLPGIAGIVLTIGMAVDANILIYERLREELNRGRDLAQGYKNGFENAMSAIVDSNMTTLIAAAVLYGVGTGPVRGFAATLAIGIITTMFSVLVFSKVILHWLVFRSKSIQQVKMMSVLAKEAKFKYISKRHLAYGFSILTIGGGLLLFGQRAEGMLGIDFAGGTTARFALAEPQEIGAVRARLPDYAVVGIGASADEAGRYAQYQVKKTLTPEQRKTLKAETAVQGGLDPTAAMVAELKTNLAEWLPKGADGQIDELAAFLEKNSVGARVSGEIQTKAVRAILLSLILTIIYISFRFKEYRYGFAAVVAVLHDVLFTLGALAAADALGILEVEISLETIAAFLTIIGFSLNDTIVIFDRIRENLPKMPGKKYEEVIDASINQCLGRTILTSMTVLFVVVVLFFTNRPFHNVLEGFSFAMIIGVLVGVYSTMFVATPMLIGFDRWSRHHMVAPAAGEAKKSAVARA